MVRVIKMVVITAVLISVLAVAGCSGGDDAGVPAPGRPAPDFQLQTLDGKEVSLSALRGRPVVVNFWATWCGPCRLEMPVFQQLYEDPEWRARGLVVLAVNLGEPSSLVKKFVETFRISFTVLLDAEQEVAMAYNAALIPTTYFIDKDGIIREIKIGAIISRDDMESRLMGLILKNET